jgi:putative tributyrin esterase
MSRAAVRWLAAVPVIAALIAVGLIGAYRYWNGFWLYRGYSPPKEAADVHVRGSAHTIYVRSAAIGGRHQKVLVYLPPGYRQHPHKHYPVMYLLHGVPGEPEQFLRTERMGVLLDQFVAERRMRPMILVAPEGSTGLFVDKEWANGVLPHQGWETFMARDVVHAIQGRYRTIARPAGRALAGMSEGAYAALNIGLHHPGEFRVIESWSGYTFADTKPTIFGDEPARLAYNSPAIYLPKAARALRRHHVYFWIFSGTKDRLRFEIGAFAAQLSHYRIPHQFFLAPGGHTWRVWRPNAGPAMLVASGRLSHG